MSETTNYEQLRAKPSKFVTEILGVEPFDYQKKILDADARHRCIVSGRQVGKSRMCAWQALHKAITNSYTKVLITAPSLRQSSLLFDTLQSEIDKSALSDKEWGIERDTQTIIEFDNGSAIHCLPTGRDGNKIRGFTADMVIVDESAFVNNKIFGDILEPMLFASNGEMVLASTPMGKSGYLYKKFKGAEHKDNWSRIQVESYDNPLVNEEDLEEYKEGKTDSQIRREVYGKFVDDAGQFFPSEAIANCMKGSRPTQESNHSYLGVDIAGTGDDRTVFYGLDQDGHLFMNDEIYSDMGVLEAAEHIKVLDGMHNFDRIFIDRTAIGQGTVESLANDATIERKIEPVYFSVQKKQQIYQRLKAGLEAEFLHLPNDETLRSELESIGSDETSAGNLKFYPRDDNGRDDLVDALALACWGLPKFGDNRQGHGAKQSVSGNQKTRTRRGQNDRGRTQNRRSISGRATKNTSKGTGSYTVNNKGSRSKRRQR